MSKLTIAPLPIPDCPKMIEILRPGRSSGVGFLNREESLSSVLENDNHTLKVLGVSHKQIVDRLVTLIEKWKWLWYQVFLLGKFTEHDSKEILVEGKYKIISCHYMGYQGCPICSFLGLEKGRETLSDCDYTIKWHGGRLRFSELVPHLIARHHFFEGHTPHRVDPAVLVTALGILPGKNYSPKWEKEQRWYQGGGSSSSECEPVSIDDIYSSYKPLFRLPSRRIDPHTVIHQNGNKILVVWNITDKGKSNKSSVSVIDGIPLVHSAFHGSGWSFYSKETCRFVRDCEN